MTAPVASGFSIGPVACRWQAAVADTLPVAREWVRGIAGAGAATGLQRDARGRPRLATGAGDIGWSHSAGRLLLAYAPAGTLGIDLERSDRRVDALRIAQRHFAAQEVAALAALDADARQAAFLRLWCAKEAVLKAHGHGIAFGLSRLALDIKGEQLSMIECDPALGRADDWQLHLLAPEPGYLAVLAWHDGILRA